MIVSFSVGNFRSFKEEQTLNLIASKRLGSAAGTNGRRHLISMPRADEDILTTAALYGPNGAGKSNLVKAIGFVQYLVVTGTDPGERIKHRPFLFDTESRPKTEPMTFELQFLAEGTVFRYGFCCSARTVHEEWLDVYRGKREVSLFSRETHEDGSVEVTLGRSKSLEDATKIRALAEVGARANQLFLTEVVNLDDGKAQGSLLRRVVGWFKETLHVIQAGQPFHPLAKLISEDKSFASFAGLFLRQADTGIAGLTVQTEVVEGASPRFKEFIGESNTTIIDGDELFVDTDDNETLKRRRIAASHDGGHILPLSEESDGSQRLLNLLPMLHRSNGKELVVVIDELERSLHPMLARKYIEFFQQTVEAVPSQLIFTTHETTLLDRDLLRRDGVWFAEKDGSGATSLYSLADFKPRNDLKIEKHYLLGRFGAIPFLGGIDRLIESTGEPEKAP